MQNSQRPEVHAVVRVVAASELSSAVPALEQKLQQAEKMVAIAAGQTLATVDVGWAPVADWFLLDGLISQHLWLETHHLHYVVGKISVDSWILLVQCH